MFGNNPFGDFPFGDDGAISVTILQVSETDTAQPFTRQKIKGLEIVSETDSAQSFTVGRPIALGMVAETDSAQPFTVGKAKTIGQVSETDSTQTFTLFKVHILGQAIETDEAGPASRFLSYPPYVPISVDSSLITMHFPRFETTEQVNYDTTVIERVTEDSEIRITEDGETRIIEILDVRSYPEVVAIDLPADRITIVLPALRNP